MKTLLCTATIITALVVSAHAHSDGDRDSDSVSVDVVTAQIVAHTSGQNIPASWKNLTRYAVTSVPDPEQTFVIDKGTIDCEPGYEPVAAWTEITGSYPSIDVMYTVDASVTDNGEVTVRMRAREGFTGYAYIDVLLLCRRGSR